jgi:hypothetical protein
MPDRLLFFRVKELPGVTVPDAIYYVKADGANGARQYVTDNDGNAFPMIQEAEVGNIDLGTF